MPNMSYVSPSISQRNKSDRYNKEDQADSKNDESGFVNLKHSFCT